MSAPDLAIVIPSWNTCDLLRDCLASVHANTGVSFEVCVVDNASTDDSPAMVGREFPQVRLVCSPRNGGFAYATNLGLRQWGFGCGPGDYGAFPPGTGSAEGLPRYALLLNSDTVVPPDGLAQMAGFLDARPSAAVAGPKLIRRDGSLDMACRRSFPTPAVSFYRFTGLSKLFPKSQRLGRYNLTYLDPDQVSPVDCVNGAFMMVRAQAIHQVGLLDEQFYFGGEDLDWAFRLKAAGWEIYYNPAVVVYHIKRASFRRNPRARYEFERAMWLFYRKHYRQTASPLLNGLIYLGLGLRGGLPLVREMLRAR